MDLYRLTFNHTGLTGVEKVNVDGMELDSADGLHYFPEHRGETYYVNEADALTARLPALHQQLEYENNRYQDARMAILIEIRRTIDRIAALEGRDIHGE